MERPLLAATEAAEKARALLRENAVRWLYETVDKIDEAGNGYWMVDPYVRNVVGFMKPGTNQAVVIVYLNESDFEYDEDLLAELAGEER